MNCVCSQNVAVCYLNDFFQETAHEKAQKYKEGKSVLERFKVSGPDGSNYWITPEAHVGGSDADDA